MHAMEYFRAMNVLTTGNLGKEIVLMVKMRHTCLPYILSLIIPPKNIGGALFKFYEILDITVM